MRLSENHQFKFAIISKVFIAILGILSTVFINRALGPSLKGEYTYLLNMINFFVLFLNLGIYQSYPNFKRKNIDELKTKYLNIVSFQALIYFLIFLLIIIFVIDSTFKVVFMLLPLYILTHQLSFILLVEKPNLKQLSSIFSEIFYLVSLLLTFIFAERTIYFVFLILFIKVAIQFIILILLFKIKLNPLKINLKLLKKSIKFGFIPMLTSVMIFLIYRMDIFILELFVTYAEIGIYSVGVSLASMTWLFTDAFKEVLFSKTSKKDSISEVKFSIKINFYFSILILFVFIIFGQFIINFLYGIEFIGAYVILLIILVGNIPMTFFKVTITLFLAQGKIKLNFILMLIPIVLGLFLYFILIPLYGIIGSALSACISLFICGLLFLKFFTKFEGVKIVDLFSIKREEILYLFRNVKSIKRMLSEILMEKKRKDMDEKYY